MKLTEIITATDLSAQAGLAARWAQKMATICGTPLVAAHVIALSLPNWLKGAFEIDEDEELRAKTEKRIRDWFDIHTDDLPDEVSIQVGDCYARLRDLAQDREGPLLVTSVSGKGSFKKFFIGSTTQALALMPPCPLAVVSDHRASLHEGMSIVLATDLMTFSHNAVLLAAELARKLGGKLIVLHALGLHESSDDPLPAGLDLEKTRSLAAGKLEAYLEKYAEVLDGVEVEPVLLNEHIVEGLSEYVEDNDIHLLVAGHVNKEDAVVENMLNRVTLKFVSHIECSVVIVPITREEIVALGGIGDV